MKFNLLLAVGISAGFHELIAATGLDFNGSVEQAKRQMKAFLARDIPVKASLNTLENYYIDHEERELPLPPRYSNLRKPCKVLPDPDPGLVNPRLVEPVHRYRPLFRHEKFYGKFAPPIKYEIINNNSNNGQAMIGAAPLPPVSRVYKQSQVQKYRNPFYGYQGNYDASKEYFQYNPPISTVIDDEEDESSVSSSAVDTDPTQPQPYPQPYPYTSTVTPPSNLSADQRLASLSSALNSNSAALASMSFSVKMASMSSVFAEKEASLRAKLAEYSATATATKTKEGWHW